MPVPPLCRGLPPPTPTHHQAPPFEHTYRTVAMTAMLRLACIACLAGAATATLGKSTYAMSHPYAYKAWMEKYLPTAVNIAQVRRDRARIPPRGVGFFESRGGARACKKARGTASLAAWVFVRHASPACLRYGTGARRPRCSRPR